MDWSHIWVAVIAFIVGWLIGKLDIRYDDFF